MTEFRIVLAGTRDYWAASESGNHFSTREEAEAAIQALTETFSDQPGDWDVVEVEPTCQ